MVWHANYPDPTANWQRLNTDEAVMSDAFGKFGNGVPNENTIALGPDSDVNSNSMIAYAWHSIPGFSAFGSYNGVSASSDGPFVYTGFRPAFIIIKGSVATSAQARHWMMFDTTINSNNPSQIYLRADQAAGEVSDPLDAIDILSNGFKIRCQDPALNNAPGDTYIYAAFAEVPQGGNNVSPANAR